MFATRYSVISSQDGNNNNSSNISNNSKNDANSTTSKHDDAHDDACIYIFSVYVQVVNANVICL